VKRPHWLLPLVLLIALDAVGAGEVDRFTPETTRPGGKGIPYRIHATSRYAGELLPVLVFLHGSGQVGTDNSSQLDGGANGAVALLDRAEREDRSLIFVAPQIPVAYWAPEQVMEVVKDVLRRYPGDPRRVYLTGLSSGATGVFDAMKDYPGCFAAAVPMSGMTEIAGLAAIAPVPMWLFHGIKDGTANIESGAGGAMVGSRALVRALRAAGGHPRYTEYDDLGHVIWARAYAEPALLPWLLAQHLPPRGVRKSRRELRVACPFIETVTKPGRARGE
jgi:predicted peptidase